MSDYIFWAGLVLGALLGIPSSIVANLVQSRVVWFFSHKRTEYQIKRTQSQKRYSDLAEKLSKNSSLANVFFATNQIVLVMMMVLSMGMLICSHVSNMSPVGVGENTIQSLFGFEFYRHRAWSVVFLIVGLIGFIGTFQLFWRFTKLIKAIEEKP